jgi:hypothetical protein
MILRRLELKHFGRFADCAFDFRRGFNLVVGPSEAGKSTLAEAVPCVLFGARDGERFKPWNGGAGCAAGVDPTGYGAAPPGLGDQRNFELLLEAGFSTPEVVQIMSANGAKVLGIDGDVGTVEAGKVADLVVIDADLEAVGNLHDTRIVFRHGVGWDSAKLIDSIRGVVGIR